MVEEIEFEDVRITQARGPTVAFRGNLIGETDFQTRSHDPLNISLVVWRTEGGALVAASYAAPADREGHETARVRVVEREDDEQAMHFEVLDHFEWDTRARSMARKQMGWDLTRHVD